MCCDRQQRIIWLMKRLSKVRSKGEIMRFIKLALLVLLSFSMLLGNSKTGKEEFQYYLNDDGTCTAFIHSKTKNLDLVLSLNNDNTYTIEGIGFVGDTLYLPDYAVDGRYITGIGLNAFREMSDVKSIRLPDGITSIGWRTFTFCQSLREVVFGRDLRDIHGSAFLGVDLDRIKISEENIRFKLLGNSLIERETGRLVLGTNLSVILPDVTEIGEGAFAGRTFETFSIPSNVQRIGEYAFSECENLHTVVLSEGIYEIQSDAFLNCYNLKNISFPQSMRELGMGAFEGTGIEAIPDLGGVTELDSNTFSRCNKLKNIVVPANVTVIGADVFTECENLEEVILPDNLKIFNGAGTFIGCRSLKNVLISSANQQYMTIEGNLIEKETMKLLVGTIDGNVPYGVKTIAEGAFAFRGTFTSVVIPESVTEICSLAFADAKQLSYLYIPESVTVVGKNIIGGNSSKLQVHCESKTPSEFWDEEWNGTTDAVIIWGTPNSVMD